MKYIELKEEKRLVEQEAEKKHRRSFIEQHLEKGCI